MEPFGLKRPIFKSQGHSQFTDIMLDCLKIRHEEKMTSGERDSFEKAVESLEFSVDDLEKDGDCSLV